MKTTTPAGGARVYNRARQGSQDRNPGLLFRDAAEMEALHLHFHGPFAPCSEISDIFDDCEYRDSTGLYLWAVELPTGCYRISYIGETGRSFYHRTKEHIIQTLGGNYRVIDADQMRQGVERIIWDGLWRGDAQKRLPEFLRRYETLAPLTKRYLFGQAIFLAPFRGETRLRRRIEVALAHHIRSKPDASGLLPGDIRYVVRKAAQSAVKIDISADRPIEGLPLELRV